MNNKNGGIKCMNSYEDECGSTKNKNCNFDFDIELNIDEADECFINNMVNTDNEDCEEMYQEGFKDGYDKAKQEVLVYMIKNKCCIKCKKRSVSKNKCCTKCKRNCKLRRINNKHLLKMIKCI